MNTILLTSLKDISAEQWNALAAQNQVNTIFQTYEWHIAWWKVFGKGKKPFLICVYDRNELVGIAPLMIEFVHKPLRKAKRILRFIGHGSSDYSDFIISKSMESINLDILKYLVTRNDEWDEIELKHIPESSRLIVDLGDNSGMGLLYYLVHETTVCPALIIRDNQEITNILNKKSLKRHYNFFHKKESFNVIHTTQQSDIELYLNTFFRQHIDRWRHTSTPSLFVSPDNQLFYQELLNELCPLKQICFTAIFSENRPIAFHFGFVYQNTFVWYKPTFAPELRKYSPGEVLLKELLEYAVRHQYDEFDFTVGGEEFKLRFANIIRNNYSYKLYTTPYAFYSAKGVQAMKTFMKQNTVGIIIIDIAKKMLIGSRILRKYNPF
jgi:CelD/BcsL family acetyltransferase involved in cellulose biosynthesis